MSNSLSGIDQCIFFFPSKGIYVLVSKTHTHTPEKKKKKCISYTDGDEQWYLAGSQQPKEYESHLLRKII